MDFRDILFVALAILAIVMAAWYFFGDSPTLEEALLVALLVLVVKNTSHISRLEERIGR